MTEFVKICPQCRRVNPEYENICVQCQQFIGMEPAIPKPLEKVKEKLEGKVKEKAPNQVTEEKIIPEIIEKEVKKTEDSGLYLKVVSNEQLLTIHHNDIIGQSHQSSSAQVQIPIEIEGVEYIHRQHCRFSKEKQQWFVQALEQTQFQQSFTNPTWQNQKLLTPGKKYTINNGDELQFSAVFFVVRIL